MKGIEIWYEAQKLDKISANKGKNGNFWVKGIEIW